MYTCRGCPCGSPVLDENFDSALNLQKDIMHRTGGLNPQRMRNVRCELSEFAASPATFP
jgi:hypothetical protein